jgi:urease accessory protein
MDSVMRTHAFRGVSYRFAPGAEVIADLSAGEARRLFGGAEQAGHAHPPGD